MKEGNAVGVGITGKSLELCLHVVARYLCCSKEQRCSGTIPEQCSGSRDAAGGAYSHAQGNEAMDT